MSRTSAPKHRMPRSEARPVLRTPIRESLRLPDVISYLRRQSNRLMLGAIDDIASEEEYAQWKDAYLVRLSTTSVVCSVFMASAAAFLTTAPPDAGVADWAHPIAYGSIGITFLCALLAVTCSTSSFIVITSVRADWALLTRIGAGGTLVTAKDVHFWLLMSPGAFLQLTWITASTSTCLAVYHGDSTKAKVLMALVMAGAWAYLGLWLLAIRAIDAAALADLEAAHATVTAADGHQEDKSESEGRP